MRRRKKTQIPKLKTIRFANLTQRMVWVPNYSDTPTVILAIFNVAFSINWLKYIHLWYSTLFVSLQKKQYLLLFQQIDQKEMSFATSFPTLFHLVSRNHVAVASLTRCLVAEFVGNRKVMSLKMSTASKPPTGWSLALNQAAKPGFHPYFFVHTCTVPSVAAYFRKCLKDKSATLTLNPKFWGFCWFHFFPGMSGQF